MQNEERFSVSARLVSFRHAFRGVGIMLSSQHNAWIHALATTLVCLLGILLGVSRIEWCMLVLAMVAVWTAEALNTALELLADAAQPEFHPLVGQAKDVAAAGVLVCAGGATLIGFTVLGPPLLAWLA